MKLILAFLFLITKLATAFFPDGLPSGTGSPTSFYHSTITKRALDAMLQDYLRTSSLCNPDATIPSSTASRWSAQKTISTCFGQNSSPAQYENAREEICRANARVDKDADTKDDPLFHFDAEKLTETNVKLISRLSDWYPILTSNITDTSLKRNSLGSMFHTIQDFYSHSNWVELGNTLINDEIAVGSIAKVAGPDDATCEDCKPIDEHSYHCNDNILTPLLTSGYIGAKPETGKKCSHGGLLDGTQNQPARGGINKDSADVQWSPHYFLHKPAAELAIQASYGFLDQVRRNVDDTTFRRLLGIGGPALAFVIDTSASMQPFIAGAKQRAFQIIDSMTGPMDKPDLYILVPFNDPDYGPTFTTDDPDAFKAQISSLTAGGGGGGSEMSFHGIYLAELAAEPNTQIIVFTDAPPKDYDLYPQIVALAKQKKLSISFELQQSSSDFSDYYNLVTNTGGLLIGTSGTVEDITKSSALFETKLAIPTVTLFHRDGQGAQLPPVDIPVDSTLFALTVTVTSQRQNCLTSITFTDPSGKQIDTSKGQLTPTAFLIVVNGTNLVIGIWKLNVAIKNGCKYSIDVLGQSRASLSFAFAEFYADSSHPSYQVVDGNPISGSELLLQIGTSDESIIYDRVIFIDPLSAGREIASYVLEPTIDGYYQFHTNITVPLQTFAVSIHGQDSKGNQVMRAIDGTVQPASILLEAIFENGHNTDGIVQGGELNILMNITNLATQGDQVTFSATDDQDFVESFSPQSVYIGSMQSVAATVQLRAPDNIRPGTVSTLQMIASSNSANVNFLQMTIPVVAKDPDVTPPVCIVTNSTYAQVCTGLDVMKNCEQTRFQALMVFSDHGRGLYRATLKASGGNWTGQVGSFDQYLVDTNVSAQIQGDCCNQNVTLTVIDVAGQMGQCFMQLNDIYPPELTIVASDFNKVCDKAPVTGCGLKTFHISYSFLDYGLGLDQIVMDVSPDVSFLGLKTDQYSLYTARSEENATFTGSCCAMTVGFTAFDMAGLNTSVTQTRLPASAGSITATIWIPLMGFMLASVTKSIFV